jgi:hypothetical protein
MDVELSFLPACLSTHLPIGLEKDSRLEEEATEQRESKEAEKQLLIQGWE